MIRHCSSEFHHVGVELSISMQACRAITTFSELLCFGEEGNRSGMDLNGYLAVLSYSISMAQKPEAGHIVAGVNPDLLHQL